MVVLYFVIQIPAVQTWVVKKITNYYSNKLHTEISIGKVKFEFFNKLVLEDVLVKDQKKDTLLFAEKLKADISVFNIFKSNFKIDKIELVNVDVFMNRAGTDSVFNYQFLIDEFATTPSAQTNESSSSNLDLKDISLEKIRFRYFDDKNYLQCSVQLLSGELNGDTVDLTNSLFLFKQITLNNPVIEITQNLFPPDSTVSVRDTALAHLNTQGIVFLLRNFKLNDAQFIFHDRNISPMGSGFDPSEMNFKNINIEVENAGTKGDKFFADSKHFSFKEKSGLTVNNLSGKIMVTPKKASIENLFFKTPNSLLTDYFAFTYTTLRDFNHFNSYVNMYAGLRNAKVSFADVEYFADGINTIQKPLLLTGNISGTVDNLVSNQLKIRTGKNTFLETQFKINGLPDIKSMFIDCQIKQMLTDYNDVVFLFPSMTLPANFYRLGNPNFTGELKGYLQNFIASGTLNTSLGSVTSDVKMLLADNFKTGSYNGNIELQKFNVGKLYAQDSLFGIVSFRGKVSGQGFMLADLNDTVTEGVFTEFDFNHYRYSNIKVTNGTFSNRKFDGNLIAKDSNISVVFHGSLDFSHPLPEYNFDAKLDGANLKALHFATNDYDFSSHLNINLRGDKIDNLVGSALVTKTQFIKQKETFSIDSIFLSITELNFNKHLSLRSDMANANVDGKFRIDELESATIELLKKYLPSLPIKSDSISQQQNFTFSANIKNADAFLAFFFPEIAGLSNSYVTNGRVNTLENSIGFTGKIPYLKYNGIEYKQISMGAITIKNMLVDSISAAEIDLSDSLILLNPYFSAAIRNNEADFILNATEKSLQNEISLSGHVVATDDSLSVQLNKNKMLLNNREWTLEKDNFIVFGKNKLTVKNLNLTQGEQSLLIGTIPSATADLRCTFTKLHVEDFYHFIRLYGYDAAGMLTGTIDVKNIFGNRFFIANASITDFVFNHDRIGTVTLKSDYLTAKNRMNIDMRVLDDKYDIRTKGYYLPAEKDTSLHLSTEVVKVNVSIFEKYLSDYISKINGIVGGQLNLGGSISKPNLTGSLTVFKAGFVINYLGTRDSLYNQTFNFYDGFIDFGDLIVDDKYGGKLELAGGVIHDHLRKFNLNFFGTVLSKGDRGANGKFFSLNTTYKDNPLFFGTAFISGAIQFKGTLDNLLIDASKIKTEPGIASTYKSKGLATSISIPISYDEGVSQNDFVHFINIQGVVKDVTTSPIKSGLQINLNFVVTPDAEMKIIFNQKTGDVVQANGSGNIRMEINTVGDFNMYGTYTIDRGTYNFTMQDYFNTKKFIITQGSTISWNGDPYEAQVAINASYLKGVKISDLLGDTYSSEEINANKKPVPAYVLMALTGSLLHPAIDFDLSIDGGTTLGKQKIQEVKQDPNELSKQVFGILALGHLLPLGSGIGSNSFQSSVNSSVSEFLSNYISYILSENSLGVNVDVNYNSFNGGDSTATSTINADKVRTLDVALSKSFGQRITIEVGGNFELGNTAAANYNPVDFEVDYKITKSGTVLAKVFSKNQYDYINDKNGHRTGAGIAFEKEFDEFKDLFLKKKKPPPKVKKPK